MKKTIGIIGGEPAGMSCALWLKTLGFQPIIFEKNEQLGGLQTINSFSNIRYLGLHGQTGINLAQQFRQHVELASISSLLNSKLEAISKELDGSFRLTTKMHNIRVHGIVIATGQRFRAYESIDSIAGSISLETSSRVCFNPGTVPATYGKVVAVVGGGDNGLGMAALLADTAEHIHLLVRSTIRGFKYNQQQVLEYVKTGRISLYTPSIIQQFDVQNDHINITISQGDESRTISAHHICFRLGYAPNVETITQLLDHAQLSLEQTAKGHIDVDPFARTSIPGIYAIGDVANPRDPCVATAVAHGAVAARSIDEDFQNSDEHGQTLK